MTKSGARKKRDPHFERERRRYKNPLPSREFILDTMLDAGVPLQDQELAKLVGISKSELPAFAKRLAAMEREGQILRNRKGVILIARKIALISGLVEGHPDGFGFVIPDDGSGDLFLSPKEVQKVLHRDRVMIREIGVDRRGRREAEIVEVIEHANSKIVGRLEREHDNAFVVPSDRRINQIIVVPNLEKSSAKSGEIVVVELIAQPAQGKQPVGRIAENLGHASDPGMEIEIALRKNGLPFKFSSKARAKLRTIQEILVLAAWTVDWIFETCPLSP